MIYMDRKERFEQKWSRTGFTDSMGPFCSERERKREREACFHMFFSNIGSSNRLGHGASKRGTWTHGEVLQQPKVVDLAKDQSSR